MIKKTQRIKRHHQRIYTTEYCKNLHENDFFTFKSARCSFCVFAVAELRRSRSASIWCLLQWLPHYIRVGSGPLWNGPERTYIELKFCIPCRFGRNFRWGWKSATIPGKKGTRYWYLWFFNHPVFLVHWIFPAPLETWQTRGHGRGTTIAATGSGSGARHLFVSPVTSGPAHPSFVYFRVECFYCRTHPPTARALPTWKVLIVF